jgi:hypothetical protein
MTVRIDGYGAGTGYIGAGSAKFIAQIEVDFDLTMCKTRSYTLY